MSTAAFLASAMAASRLPRWSSVLIRASRAAAKPVSALRARRYAATAWSAWPLAAKMRPTVVWTMGFVGSRKAPCWAWAMASPQLLRLSAMRTPPRMAKPSPKLASSSVALRAVVTASPVRSRAMSTRARREWARGESGASWTAFWSAFSASAFCPREKRASPRAICAMGSEASRATALSAVSRAPGPSSLRTWARALAAREWADSPASTAMFAILRASRPVPLRRVKVERMARASAL